MRTTVLTKMPVSVLWDYREFKRDEVAAPVVPFLHGHSLEEIIDYVKEHGLDPVELSVVKDRALLTDGNHRLVAARRLGIEKIPVNVTVFFGDGADTFYDHTLERFKPIDGMLEVQLKRLFL
jgi:hypothetical protein